MPASDSLPVMEKVCPGNGRKATVLSATVAGDATSGYPEFGDLRATLRPMGVLQRVLAKMLPRVDKRFDWRIDQKLEERVLPELPKQTETLEKLSRDVESALFTMSELRRWMVDDLEAANETTMLLGETLTRLQSSIDRLEQEVTAIGKRLGDIEASVQR